MKADTRQNIVIAFGFSIASTVCLLWALLGEPPYAFYSILKMVVAATCGVIAYYGFAVTKWFTPIAIGLVGLGYIHLFEKMRREQWMPFNWAAVIVIWIGFLLLWGVVKKKQVKQ